MLHKEGNVIYTMIRIVLIFSSMVLFFPGPVKSGMAPLGINCSASNNHLDLSTHKFITECPATTFCSAPEGGSCLPKLCRRDEFPFEYASGDIPVPPMCEKGMFCPDEGSGCEVLSTVGEPCQLNRDEQCTPPVDWQELASTQNFNGSLCLNSICMFANMTLGQACIIDNTTYIDIGPDGQQYSNVVTRDNCRSPQFYCDPISMVCQRTKPLGSPCDSDHECESYHCGWNRRCAAPPETPVKVLPWQYALTALCIVAAMTATCVMLTLIHRRHRLERYKEVREYYYEQISIRHSIIALHTAAADQYGDQKQYDEHGPW